MSREVASTNTSSEAENINASSTQNNASCVQNDEKKERHDELRLKFEKQRQDHIVALQGKNDEIRAKDHEIANLNDEIYKLKALNSTAIPEQDKLQTENTALRLDRENKVELQKEICDLNEKLNRLSPLQRDYEDAINLIIKLTAERDSLREGREEYFDQSRRLEEQVDEQAKDLDNERRKCEVLHTSSLNLAYEIQRLTKERNEWKEKFEEIKNKTKTDKKANDKKNVHTYSYVVVSGGDEENENNPSGNEESFKRQSNMKNVNLAKRPNPTDHYDQPTNDSGEVSLASGGSDQPQPRKKRFYTVPCTIPCCKNCGIIFHETNLMATECRFHRVQPQSYEVWTKFRNQDTVRVNPRLRGHLFWPCCESHGRNQTEGCMVLRHHEIVYPDE